MGMGPSWDLMPPDTPAASPKSYFWLKTTHKRCHWYRQMNTEEVLLDVKTTPNTQSCSRKVSAKRADTEN